MSILAICPALGPDSPGLVGYSDAIARETTARNHAESPSTLRILILMYHQKKDEYPVQVSNSLMYQNDRSVSQDNGVTNDRPVQVNNSLIGQSGHSVSQDNGVNNNRPVQVRHCLTGSPADHRDRNVCQVQVSSARNGSGTSQQSNSPARMKKFTASVIPVCLCRLRMSSTLGTCTGVVSCSMVLARKHLSGSFSGSQVWTRATSTGLPGGVQWGMTDATL